MSVKKEPSFFTDWVGGVRELADYEALFSHCCGANMAVGEASTGYLYDPNAPSKIFELLGGVRIIIILRNPVDMSFALWRHMRRIGKRGEGLPFRGALDAEPARIADPSFNGYERESWYANFHYFNRALYHEQVSRYIDTFGRENVRVYLFEEFRKDPLKTCRDLYSFIGVDPDFTPGLEAQNVGVDVRHRGLGKLVKAPPAPLKMASKVLPGGLVSGVKGMMTRLNTRPTPKLDEALRKELVERYRPDVLKLSALIGKDLTGWLAP